MTKQTTHVTYEEFMARMPAILEELDNDEEALTFEAQGRTYKVELADVMLQPHNPKRLRRALDESAGALAGVDIEKLKRDLREMREQDSSGRPA